MAFSKAKLFPPLLYAQSFWSKALSHPARITILRLLLHEGTTYFQTICKRIPLATTTVSQHLRYLREAGLIEAGEDFPHTWYRLNKSFCRELARRMEAIEREFSMDQN